jgi:hypothetical protein
VHGAADREAARLRHLQQLHHHALAGEGGVAVDQHGSTCLRSASAAAGLARAHAAGDHRVDDLQVRGVEASARCTGPPGVRTSDEKPMWYFTSPEWAGVVGLVLALELVEQLVRRLAERVDQHVQAAAVGHADDHVLDAVVAGAVDQVVQQRDQALAAFQREALLADVLGVQVALQALGRGQLRARGACRRREPKSPPAASRRSYIQRRCSASVMCMNSAPIEPQ